MHQTQAALSAKPQGATWELLTVPVAVITNYQSLSNESKSSPELPRVIAATKWWLTRTCQVFQDFTADNKLIWLCLNLCPFWCNTLITACSLLITFLQYQNKSKHSLEQSFSLLSMCGAHFHTLKTLLCSLHTTRLFWRIQNLDLGLGKQQSQNDDG